MSDQSAQEFLTETIRTMMKDNVPAVTLATSFNLPDETELKVNLVLVCENYVMPDGTVVDVLPLQPLLNPEGEANE